MNLQRREEIRELIAEIARYEELGATLDLEGKARDAITELLAHIDTLEQAAAERVIRGGSRGPTPDYTGEGSAWVPPAEAWAVVVPLGDTFTLDLDEFGKSLARITINSKNRGVGYQLCGTMGDGHFSRRTFDITPYLGHCLNLIGIRAIPTDRVLGEGMVAVDSLLYAALINLEKAVVREWGLCCTGDRLWNRQKAIADRRDALRASQGGADHD